MEGFRYGGDGIQPLNHEVMMTSALIFVPEREYVCTCDIFFYADMFTTPKPRVTSLEKCFKI